ncbi:threonine/serine exporter ThrE family protein [Duncaniella sp.]|uniref:threonine/serine ThrE exporter family protein n=1 Tax=Duncaniella sp. TaxID=2518496 RepID=UPI002628725A|nr:threonine/serine exporter family protein [Duncaniella sp.]
MMTKIEQPMAPVTAGIRMTREGETVKKYCLFLSEYAAWLLGAGATCIRLERNVKRMAEAFDHEVVMTIMPRHIHMTVCNRDRSDSYTYITALRTSMISFDINTRLSELSWAVADGRLDFRQAEAEFNRIVKTPPADKRLVLLLASCANASFCRLFGGDLPAMAIVFIATLAGYYLKQVLCEQKVDMRIIFIMCAFVSSVLGATDALFHLGQTPEIAIGTSVLYLVPGIPFLNSFSDMLAGHYICSFSRFMHAMILTGCLSIGLCGGMMMMNIGMF